MCFRRPRNSSAGPIPLTGAVSARDPLRGLLDLREYARTGSLAMGVGSLQRGRLVATQESREAGKGGEGSSGEALGKPGRRRGICPDAWGEIQRIEPGSVDATCPYPRRHPHHCRRRRYHRPHCHRHGLRPRRDRRRRPCPRHLCPKHPCRNPDPTRHRRRTRSPPHPWEQAHRRSCWPSAHSSRWPCRTPARAPWGSFRYSAMATPLRLPAGCLSSRPRASAP